MIRDCYHLNNGVVGCSKAFNDKQIRHYDYFTRAIKDCIKQLRKGHTTFCQNESELRAITRQVKCTFNYNGVGYTLTPSI